jgi:hypothetical protein
LKQLAKDYRNANSPDLKPGIASRAEELMGQLFDAKVQFEQDRISALEQRLSDERRKLKDMQNHKRDLVHTGTRKALESGTLPDWATPPGK